MASPGIKQLLAAWAGKPRSTPVFGIGQNPIPSFIEGYSPPRQRPNTLFSPGGQPNPGMLERLTPWQGPSFNENIVPTGPRTPTQMGATREELIDKLKKLQALADRTPFPGEARIARDKVQELIQKYQVTDAELGIRVAPVPPPQQRPSPPQTPQPPQRPTPQTQYNQFQQPLSEEERVKLLQSIRQQQAEDAARSRKEQENFMKKLPRQYRRI